MRKIESYEPWCAIVTHGEALATQVGVVGRDVYHSGKYSDSEKRPETAKDRKQLPAFMFQRVA